MSDPLLTAAANLEAVQRENAALRTRCAELEAAGAVKDEALRETIAHVDAKILGKSILGYLHEQFPATEGHLPLHDYCCGLVAALVACSAALRNPSPAQRAVVTRPDEPPAQARERIRQ